jgi:adenosine deaminase
MIQRGPACRERVPHGCFSRLWSSPWPPAVQRGPGRARIRARRPALRPEDLRFHIRAAIETAGAHRIGHGTAIAFEDDAPDLLADMRERGVLVEVALSSAEAILGVSGSDHPISLYLDHGVPVALVTDDEAVLRTDITLEYVKAAQRHALDYRTLKKMAHNSIAYSFAGDSTRARLLRELDAAFLEFERMQSLMQPDHALDD